MSKSLYGPESQILAPQAAPLRMIVASALRGASGLLVRLASRVHAEAAAGGAEHPPELEFYAEAGAPEGALYLDGELVGYLHGVRRL